MTGAMTTVTRSKKRRCVEAQGSAGHTESSIQPNCSQTAGPVNSGIYGRLELMGAPSKSVEKPLQLEEKDCHLISFAPRSNNPVGVVGASSSTEPSRIMRCELPARSRRSISPLASSSTIKSMDVNETQQAARLMRCTLPAQPIHPFPVSLASCSSSQCDDLNESQVVPPARIMRSAGSSRSKIARCTAPTTSESALLQGDVIANINSTPEDEVKQTRPSEVLPICMSEVVADPESLKCREGQSSYPLRALKIVPKYHDNGFGIAAKPKVKPHTVKEDVIKTNDMCSGYGRSTEFDNSPINFLPNEIFCMIFSYLPQLELLRTCSRVCHRWRSIAMTPTLWQTLCIRGQDVPIEIVRGCIKQSSMLKSITIKDRQDIDAILPVLHQQSKRLESVNLIRCRPCDASKRNLHAKYLYPFLRKGQLHNLNLKGTDYKSRKFYQMLSGLPSLEKLNISCSKSISPQILVEIAKQKNLKVFKNKWHSNSIYHGPKSMTIQLPGKIDEWSNAYSQLFHNAGRNLTTLEFYAAGISNAALLSLSNCKKLKKLFIYNANCFGSESMAAVCNLPELQELLIHNAKLKAVDVLDTFQNGNLSGLQCLHLNECVQMTSNEDVSADACLKMLAEKCAQLKHLSFTKCCSVSDDGVQSVLRNCPKLESLDLNGAHGVSGQSFLEIPNHTPHLKLLITEENCSEQKSEVLKTLIEKHGINVSTVSTWKHRCTPHLL
ncbi:F-box/LRR-repeat protein 7-like isoform X2 [Thrips palmi]|uniref:F-box/LRR-repeat protein 7-like isoform X2 n=1 Tax=Thrips palmi TaxID=161013 RepID=A0A6P8YFG8_THRPL|nr:F-box/LRR-repeat protein 7-like isoform X2 [Thrips palmi]